MNASGVAVYSLLVSTSPHGFTFSSLGYGEVQRYLAQGTSGEWWRGSDVGRSLDSVVLETDAPDMAPVMFPGVRNSPEHLPEIAGVLAQVMGVDVAELAQASTRNACELFGW